MKKIDIDIIHKTFSGVASEEETEKLKSWTEGSEENRIYVEKLKWIWDNSELIKEKQLEEYNPDTEAALIKLHLEVNESMNELPKSKPKKWSWVGIAASILLILGSWQGFLMFNKNDHFSYTTNKGETKEFVLPDSSKVVLGENSKLVYVNNGKNRLTKMKGEGYFEVTKNTARPFIIKGQNTGITVVGTKFNFKSRNDTATDLIHVTEGKVKFYDLKDENGSITLTKGEFGTFEKDSNSLYENKTTNKNITAWATGQLQFENIKLSTVIKDIEKHYGVLIQVENKELLNCSLTTEFNNEKLSVVIETIALIYQAEVGSKDGANYIFKKGSCS